MTLKSLLSSGEVYLGSGEAGGGEVGAGGGRAGGGEGGAGGEWEGPASWAAAERAAEGR